MNEEARAQWESIYSDLSREHSNLAGSIINRAEALDVLIALACFERELKEEPCT